MLVIYTDIHHCIKLVTFFLSMDQTTTPRCRTSRRVYMHRSFLVKLFCLISTCTIQNYTSRIRLAQGKRLWSVGSFTLFFFFFSENIFLIRFLSSLNEFDSGLRAPALQVHGFGRDKRVQHVFKIKLVLVSLSLRSRVSLFR